jgi:hypothetical protein
MPEIMEELAQLRTQGWIIQPEAREDGTGVVAVLLPPRKGMERLALSVMAAREVIEARADEILKIMLEQREDILPKCRSEENQRHDRIAMSGMPALAAQSISEAGSRPTIHV